MPDVRGIGCLPVRWDEKLEALLVVETAYRALAGEAGHKIVTPVRDVCLEHLDILTTSTLAASCQLEATCQYSYTKTNTTDQSRNGDCSLFTV